MDGFSYTHYAYKLRSSGAVPMGPGAFLAQIFGVDKNKIITYEASTTLPNTCQFMGANVIGEFMQANFQRLPYLTSAGKQLFSGSITYKTEFLDTSTIPGQGAV